MAINWKSARMVILDDPRYCDEWAGKMTEENQLKTERIAATKFGWNRPEWDAASKVLLNEPHLKQEYIGRRRGLYDLETAKLVIHEAKHAAVNAGAAEYDEIISLQGHDNGGE